MIVDKHKLISIMGTMGCGKTTAAQLLTKKSNLYLVEENFADNLFLESFYQDMPRWAFHSQTFFLTEKINQLQQIKLALKKQSVIQDTPIYQDVFSYAKAHFKLKNMTDKEWQLYQKIFQSLSGTIPKPNLIIYLQTSVNVAYQRMINRGREFELDTPIEYLKLLHDLNEQWIKKNQQNFKILTINTDQLDLVKSKKDQRNFINQITSLV